MFLSAENITGNWDPTAHTTLSQTNIEGFVMGFLTRAPMRPENPDEVIYELATEINEIDAFTLEIKLREGVTFHDGKPFKAEDVKATFEYGSQLDRPKQVYPGPTDTFEVTTPDDYTVVVDTSKGGYGASLFIFLASYLPMLSARRHRPGAERRPLPEAERDRGRSSSSNSAGERHRDGGVSGLLPRSADRPGRDLLFRRRRDDTHAVLAQRPGGRDRAVGTRTGRDAGTGGRHQVVPPRLGREQVPSSSGAPSLRSTTGGVRKAAAHAIDRSILWEVMGSAGEPSSNWISPIKFGYIDLESYPEYDPEECQRLLAEAGYPGGEGLPELEYLTSTGFYPKTKEYGEVITALLQEQGFPVRLNVMEVAAWNERLYDRPGGGPGHMVDCGWSTGSPEPDLVLRTHFHSTSKRICGIEDPEIDAALDEERNAPSLEARRESLQTNLMPLLAQKVPALSLFTSVLIHGMRSNVDGLFIYPDGVADASEATLG